MPRLVYFPHTNETIFTELTSPVVTIGRHPSNTIPLTGRMIHKHHAALRREPDGSYRLFDLMHRNVVVLHDQLIPEAGVVLRHGDNFTVSNVRCRYRDWNRAPAEFERTVTVQRDGDHVRLSFRSYQYISAASDFVDDWQVDVVPELAALQHCHVHADLARCPCDPYSLFSLIAAAGARLESQGCQWQVRLSGEPISLVATIWQRPEEEVLATLQKSCRAQFERA